ncbi:Methyl-accepting chemotaxis protein (MCP) signalling domain-containing protein [Thermanaeromonas toyohensis ToBE]|uniref:Methyl-accepting chemotaxis protein (MCP) signalling domain-containing protein n=1 Tax=Thermanaeromonas toyohensis ToBE TaxID=698762 RepID=A0A1W1VDZ7_9FIRM|nr:methyl-accepting chemotaxis protein [Thermanaeromonas toyohensis]SMB91667.1 Methyl-accepting chemotaxis protein (MCP) signalling domain-containing protein [Thermanaeromonas toyohensis ToBE]
MVREEEYSLLYWLAELAPLFQACFPLDCTISVTDREKYLAYFRGQELDLKVKPGMAVPVGGTIEEALKTGRPSRKVIPEQVLGVPFKSTAVPIRDKKGQVVGALGIGVSLKNQEKLLEAANNITATLEEITATMQELAAAATQLADSQNKLLKLGENIREKIKKTDTILGFVQEVAETSKLLGLNAAIEAARAGEHGRGFSVVAEEIRKLASNSAQAVKEIQKVLEEIRKDVQAMYHQLAIISGISQEQAQSTHEAAGALETLSATAMNLRELAEII